jgi:uncharacterized protein YggT (Ycf19 family)
MSIERKERVAVISDDGYEQRQKVSEIGPSRKTTFVERTIQVIGFITTMIALLIAIRFVLQVLGANEANAFANIIFQLSNPLVMPFAGLFPNVASDDLVVEWSTLVAGAVYILLGWLMTWLVRIVFGSSRAVRHTRTVERTRG